MRDYVPKTFVLDLLNLKTSHSDNIRISKREYNNLLKKYPNMLSKKAKYYRDGIIIEYNIISYISQLKNKQIEIGINKKFLDDFKLGLDD